MKFMDGIYKTRTIISEQNDELCGMRTKTTYARIGNNIVVLSFEYV